MSHLSVFSATDPSTVLFQSGDQEEIKNQLQAQGIQFEQWEANQPLSDNAPSDEILLAYQDSIDRLKQQGGYQSADVISLSPDHPQKDELRKKFLDEHTHAEDEVRFFVRGDGLFYLHLDECVYALHCVKGDLISVPAKTRHWFDMGANPNFTAIRIFTNPEGWVAELTGDDIAGRFPTYEQLLG